MPITPADSLDLAVARAFHGTAPEQTPGERMFAEAMGMDPLVVSTAALIFSFDQEALEQPWHRLSEHRRQPYYDIAEAVLRHVRGRC